MMRIVLLVPVLLAGCALRDAAPETPADPNQIRPEARPEAAAQAAFTRPPPAAARTEEEFDTTTVEERAEAAAAPADPGGERALGTTVASLGDPTQPGFWLETPLVAEVTPGRVLYPGSGLSAQVELRPINGPASAGSRLSLPAMRLIEAPLTDLPVVEVFAGGTGGQL